MSLWWVKRAATSLAYKALQQCVAHTRDLLSPSLRFPKPTKGTMMPHIDCPRELEQSFAPR